MKKLIFFITLITFLSCIQSADNKNKTSETSVQQTDTGKEKAISNAVEFINAYVENCNKMKESTEVVQWVNANTLTTNNFRTELKSVMDEAFKAEPEIGLDADPIFDAQDYPDKGFELDSFDSISNFVVVRGKDWPDFKLTVKMVLENGAWLVDGCGIINIPDEKRMAK